ncbi:MAG: hypothetical protein DPW15_12155 [Chloroflexi bacterium]|nr:hypothetical protein [Chloroflexota bacterium]NUQ60261.1 hypothetical protein [Anaerolineales bacterium]
MKNLLKPFLAVLLILLVFSAVVARSNAAPGVAQLSTATNTPRITATAPLPTKTPYNLHSTPAGNRPPQCAFPLESLGFQESAIASPAMENFSFSEPQVVLSSPDGISLVAWLPDNKTLLIKRRQPSSVKETIETFNTRTRQSQIYAVQDGSSNPIWLSDLNAVAYTTSVGKSNNSSKVDRYELWISYGSLEKQRLISADVSLHSAALLGEKLMYLSPSAGVRPQIWDGTAERAQTTPIDLESFVYSKFPQFPVSTPALARNLQIASHPQGRWSAFYGSALLFLADSETGQVCEIDLGVENTLPRWAYDLRWSADGRYLAMITTSAYPGELIKRNFINTLDVSTGAIYQSDLGSFIDTIDWVPNAPVLTALARTNLGDGRGTSGLFLVNVIQGQAQQALTWHLFGGTNNLAVWSPDRKSIAVDCTWRDTLPAITPADKFRICLIQVAAQH